MKKHDIDFELSYESDGEMGKDRREGKNMKEEMNEEAMFFNTTQNSE